LVFDAQKRLEQEFTYKPHINKNARADNVSVYIRLNQDSKIRENKIKAMRLEEQRSFSKSNSISNLSPPLSERRYEKLYNDGVVYKENKIKASDEIFKKNGYTFTPKINENIKITSNFYERNNNFINAKKEILQEFEKKMKENQNENKRPKYNKELANVIIERLYTKDIDKVRKRNISEEKNIKFRKYDKQPKNNILQVIENLQNDGIIPSSEDSRNIQHIEKKESLKQEPTLESKDSLKKSINRKDSKDEVSSSHRLSHARYSKKSLSNKCNSC
jgi:hypothetical protein